MINMENLNRDYRQVSDVREMADLGRFGEELEVYGSGVMDSNGEIRYYASFHEKELWDYVLMKQQQGEFFVPVQKLSERTQIPAGMREELVRSLQYRMIRQMKADFEKTGYFEKMNPFFRMQANDNALGVLEAYWEDISGYYDTNSLQLFYGALQTAMAGKVLSENGYARLYVAYEKELRQTADDPVAEDRMKRTFYGYTNQEGAQTMIHCDARELHLREEWNRDMAAGKLPMPIMKKACFCADTRGLSELRSGFRNWVKECQDEKYYRIIRAIRACRGVIDKTELARVCDSFVPGSSAEVAARFWLHQWNGTE